MAGCSYCDETVQIPFSCSLCNRKYCGSHKMPEYHSCYNIRAFNTDKFKKAKLNRYDNERLDRGRVVIFMEQAKEKYEGMNRIKKSRGKMQETNQIHLYIPGEQE